MAEAAGLHGSGGLSGALALSGQNEDHQQDNNTRDNVDDGGDAFDDGLGLVELIAFGVKQSSLGQEDQIQQGLDSDLAFILGGDQTGDPVGGKLHAGCAQIEGVAQGIAGA